MKVRLRELKDNPFRDMQIDPIQDEILDRLEASIRKDGFWNGVACRRSNGAIEIACGHHRVRAAIRAGETEAEVFIGNFDDASMIRVYASENATQRGNSVTALAGCVASSVRFLAKAIMSNEIGPIGPISARSLELARGNIVSEKGLGHDLVLQFLLNIPGLNEHVVKDQLANLKTSGAYARIIAEVKTEIEQEEPEESVVEQASTAVASAQEHEPRIFDFEGVSRHLSSDYHLRTFREAVTKGKMREILPLAKQAPLAKRLVKEAEENEVNLTALFIKKHIRDLAARALGVSRRSLVPAQQRVPPEEKMRQYQEEFSGHLRKAASTSAKIVKLISKHPSTTFRFAREFVSAVRTAKKMVDTLSRRIGL
jgi:hypothetical protein